MDFDLSMGEREFRSLDLEVKDKLEGSRLNLKESLQKQANIENNAKKMLEFIA